MLSQNRPCILALLLFFSTSIAQSSAQQAGTTVAFVGARIIDGTGQAAIEHGTLLIRNGRVEAIGAKVKLPNGVKKIDATGKTIIPGLINAHGHVNDISQLNIYLRDGITTVQSLGG